MSQEQAAVEATHLNRHDEQLAKFKASLPKFIAALEGLGATEVVFSYSGEGDEGEIYDFEIISPSETEEELPGTMGRDLQDWAYDILAEECAGWMDGDGSRGEIHLDVAAQTVTIHHEYRVYDYEAVDPIVVLTAAPNPSEQGESSA